MRAIFEDHLFAKGRLVAETSPSAEVATCALATLRHLFGIHVTSGTDKADVHMVRVASRNLGIFVPQPFYVGFPSSVRKMEPIALVIDQLLHYAWTYGLGHVERAGHSILEEAVERIPLKDDVSPRSLAIVSTDDAKDLIAKDVDGLLAATRPLSEADLALVLAAIEDLNLEVKACANKDTACRLILTTRDASLAQLLTLPDVMRLTEWMAYLSYGQQNTRKLNLRNRDRKLLTAVLNAVLERKHVSLEGCLEKRRAWAGLLHHLHYRPATEAGKALCAAVRGHEVRSQMASYEQLLAQGEVVDAARFLASHKGDGALLRSLTRLVSACESDEDVERVLEIVSSSNRIVLVQLLHRFAADDAGERIFRFPRFGVMVTHRETKEEAARRKSRLSSERAARVRAAVGEMLSRSCHGTLGTVYVADDFRRIALPVQEAASTGGVGTLPAGSHVPVEDGSTVRVFCWWRGVDDIDLSSIGITVEGETVEEFSWQTNGAWDTGAIVCSGDETSGMQGGSEYIDVDLDAFQDAYPHVRYLVFVANVYTSNVTFDACTCRAGHMMRQYPDSGEVYEPATVKTAVQVSPHSRFCYLLALDVPARELVHLGMGEALNIGVAAMVRHDRVLRYLHATEVISLYDLACLLATEITDDPSSADVAFTDDTDVVLKDSCERISSRDTERVRALLG